MALEATHKFVFVDGTLTGPEPSYTTFEWLTINTMIVSWITNTINSKAKSSLFNFRDAHRLWDHLRSRFALVNGSKIHQIKHAISKSE